LLPYGGQAVGPGRLVEQSQVCWRSLASLGMNGEFIAIRRVLALHKYTGLLFPAVFLAELAFCVWAYTVGPDKILWLLLAGGLAGLIPSALNTVALWLGHSGLRESGRPDRLAAALRTVTVAFWIGCFSWIVPLTVGFLLDFGRGGSLYLIGVMCALPIFMLAMSIRTSGRRLALAQNAVSQPVLGSGAAS
jgi:hypothetical protein